MKTVLVTGFDPFGEKVSTQLGKSQKVCMKKQSESTRLLVNKFQPYFINQ